MTKEALKMAMEALEGVLDDAPKVLEASITGGLYEVIQCRDAITAIKEALAQPEKPKYRRGDRLICLETEDYCVIHISGTDRQWVKFPDSHIGVYTNEQVSELFELLPKETEQEPVEFEEWHKENYMQSLEKYGESYKNNHVRCRHQGWLGAQSFLSQRKPLTNEEIEAIWRQAITQDNGRNAHLSNQPFVHIARAIEAAHGIKEGA